MPRRTKVLSSPPTHPPRLLRNDMQVELVALADLRSNPDSARRFKPVDVRTATMVLDAQNVIPPLVIDRDGTVLVGEIVLRAAQALKKETLPAIRVDQLSPTEAQAMSLAYQRLAELGEWDRGQLAQLHVRFELELPDYRPEHVGFEVGAIDILLGEPAQADEDDGIEELTADGVAVSRQGDMWLLGKHRILCGDSTDAATFATLMSGVGAAALVFTDPPFGCVINGFVAREGRHREFVMGSNGMSPDELAVFFTGFITAFLPHLKSGAVVELVIDWRSLHSLFRAAEPLLGPLVNLAVWAKDRPGQGSFLRSQHELVLVFKAGNGRMRNNVQLGRHGRNRSNLWSYPSAKTASTGSDEGDMLQHHPTPKPVRMVADAILDVTRRGDIVIDAFLGSGTTLIAAEKVGRVCYGVELDPLYVDLAVRRWQAWTGGTAIHHATGRSFDVLEAERVTGDQPSSAHDAPYQER